MAEDDSLACNLRQQRYPRSWKSKIPQTILCFWTLAFLLLIVSGCKKEAPASRSGVSTIHAINRELAAAAKSAAPSGTTVRMGMLARTGDPKSKDQLEIVLSQAAKGSAHSTFAKIAEAMNGVAARHRMTVEKSQESGDDFQISYRIGGQITHAVHIQLSDRAAATPVAGNARLAIILDDVGSDPSAVNAIYALQYPLTLSILPNHEHSTEIAREASRRGFQVMLHLPMQSIGKESPEREELRPGMSATETSAFLDRMLDSVPDAIGINNHQGSQATSDSALMSELMPLLKDKNLFYVDSRTTATTVAYDTAQKDGVRSAFRNVPFLDDVQDVAAIRKQLELALRGAKKNGTAIAIGHPHATTLQALREFLPRAGVSGVQLVFASELVR